MRDLTSESAEAVMTERRRVATEGWGAKLLEIQGPDGNWGGGAWVYRSWGSTLETLMLLREMGLDPTSSPAQVAIERVSQHSNWGKYHNNAPFFEGETEPCINGRVLALGAYFGKASDRLAERLISQQLEDGGWNCDAPPSTRSSFNSTICVLEGLLEYERATGSNEARAARRHGQEYLLERHLCRSLSSGEIIKKDRKDNRSDWTRFKFPTRWHYDVLWGLDYLRKAGVRDDRTADATDLVVQRQHQNGRWPAGRAYEGDVHFDVESTRGTASRWNTLRALRVLRWHL